MRTSAAGLESADRRPGEGETAVRDQLVLQHLGLVKALAHRLARRLPSQVEISDLIGVGVVGLIEAAHRYRPSMGVPFDAFARQRLQGAMLDALRDLDWAPRSLRKVRRDLDSTIGRLRHELRREPKAPEVAAAMDLSAEKYARVLEQLRGLEIGAVRQLDTAAGDGTPLLELCIDPGEGPESGLARRELRGLLAQAVLDLPERERHVLALYYEEELTMAEVGEALGVSESRVSQLRSLALARLRSCLRRSLGLSEGQASAPEGRGRIGSSCGTAVAQAPVGPWAWPVGLASATPGRRPAARMVAGRGAGRALPAALAAGAFTRPASAPAMLEQAVA
jgi:RNA polymerase sigma factor for flagellar operon FliA